MPFSTRAATGVERRGRRWRAAPARAAAWAGLLVTTSLPAGAAPGICQHIAMPVYARPGAMWDQVSAAAPTLRYAIVNPANGPGTGSDEDYEVTVSRAQRRGVEVLGYVDTEYGRRQPAAVRADIDRYEDWYGLDGIFLDRVTGAVADIGYYGGLARHVRSDLGMTLALNPGSHPDEGYVTLADVLVTFEGDAGAYLQLTSPGWVAGYPPETFWHLVYSASEAQLPQVLELARSRGVGNVYVTDRGLDNPWDVVPSYWELERDAVARTAGACTPPSIRPHGHQHGRR